MITYNSEQSVFESDLLDNPQIIMGFSVRETGDSRQSENVLRYFKNKNISFKTLIIPDQIHSSNVQLYEEAKPGYIHHIPDTDAVVTSQKQTMLMTKTADCLPILYIDTTAHIVGISHNGWRGSLKGISMRVIQKMEALGATAENIYIILGPCIGQCCYQVSEDRYIQFQTDSQSDFDSFYKRGEKWHLNLLKFNFESILRQGIRKDHIDWFPFCTSCQKRYFYSYRRDYHKNPQDFGEMFSFIMIQ